TTVYYSDPEKFTLEVIVDKNIIEIFVNNGELYFAAPYDGNKTDIVEAFVKGRGNRKSILTQMEVHELKSIWPTFQTTTNTGK
ncbi:MAG TPA: GH32 C-terminal domain-containing protein, partial [Cyclobacteriaceae bacterium]|nr:GH32 C-terminal domain-containing protein [Cyclobacteriaceae bacterium]